jgi:hypothetical protein
MTMLIHLLLIVAIIAAVVIIPYVLGTKGIFLYGKKEGFVSILVTGVENGVFDRVVGSMKGYDINPETGDIIKNPDALPSKKGLMWIGMWPLHSAMVFDTEQTKIINNDDGSIGLYLQKYEKTIYVPIRSTERLVVRDLELSDLASKIDLDVVITYVMTNVYTAKVKNRGSNKLLKSWTEEGLRETAATMPDYAAAIGMKNATDTASLKSLVEQINSRDCGYGPLSEETGYELESINVIGLKLSGAEAKDMSKSYASIRMATNAAKASEITNAQEAINITRTGIAEAGAKALLVTQTIRRLDEQSKLTDNQALAMAIENGLAATRAQVVNIGGGGGSSTLLNLDGKSDPKKQK